MPLVYISTATLSAAGVGSPAAACSTSSPLPSPASTGANCCISSTRSITFSEPPCGRSFSLAESGATLTTVSMPLSWMMWAMSRSPSRKLIGTTVFPASSVP